jgi:hypothetical protein
VPDVAEQHLGADEREDGCQAVAEVVEAVQHPAQQEVQAGHAEQAEGVGGEHDERVARDGEDRRHGIDGEQHVEGRDHEQAREQRRGDASPGLARQEALAVVVAHRQRAAQQAHHARPLDVDLVRALAGKVDRGQHEQGAEDVDRRVEGVERGGAREDEDRAQHDRAGDPPHEHAPLRAGGHAEVREQHGEDEEVVERQALLDQEAAQVLPGAIAAGERREHAGEGQPQRGPRGRPQRGGAQRRRRLAAADRLEVDQQQRDHGSGEQGPGEDGHGEDLQRLMTWRFLPPAAQAVDRRAGPSRAVLTNAPFAGILPFAEAG